MSRVTVTGPAPGERGVELGVAAGARVEVGRGVRVIVGLEVWIGVNIGFAGVFVLTARKGVAVNCWFGALPVWVTAGGLAVEVRVGVTVGRISPALVSVKLSSGLSAASGALR